MGGKRIANRVRRALIAAAKVAPVAVAIDATGCTIESGACANVMPLDGSWLTADAGADSPAHTDAGKDGD